MILATPDRHLQTIEPHVGEIVTVNCNDRRDSRMTAIIFEYDEDGKIVSGKPDYETN